MMDYKQFSYYQQLVQTVRSAKSVVAFGVAEGEKAVIANCIDKFIYITTDYIKAKKLTVQLNSQGNKCVFLPYKDDVLAYRTQLSAESIIERNTALYHILNGASVVVCVESMCQLLLDRQLFQQSVTKYRISDKINRDQILTNLINCGYTRAELVSCVGEFAIRGEIIDIFTPLYSNPIRINLFDCVIESINFFDLSSHRSQGACDEVVLFPIVDVLYNSDGQQCLKKLLADINSQKLSPSASNRLAVISSSLMNNLNNNYMLCYAKNSMLAEYLSSDTTVIFDEPKLIADKVFRYYNEHYSRVAALLDAGEILPQHSSQLIDSNQALASFKIFNQIGLQQISSLTSFFTPYETINLNSTQLINYRYNQQQLPVDIHNWLINGYKIIIYAGNNDGAQRLRLQLIDLNFDIEVSDKLNSTSVIIPSEFENGFVSHLNKLVVIGTKDILSKTTTKQLSKSKSQIFLSPEAGDYVVHVVHGIGICQGLTSITNANVIKDYIIVKYKDEDTLYVPVENSNLLSKYSGDSNPHLNRIGGDEFAKTKARVKAQLKVMAIDLIKLYAQREGARGFTFNYDKYLADEFSQLFPYQETDDQLKSINEIDNDLSATGIMDRLLVGDVGFGKTEVSMRAAFRVVSNGYQVAFLAPTTILAQQHYDTFVKRFNSFDINVRCLNRFRSAKEAKQILADLAAGKVDIIIGTHRLLGKDVHFSKLGLLILDEEQRFGVEHKEKLKVTRSNVDVLSMSATPIPRTLHMSLVGMRDISIIATPPKNRQPIESYVVEDSDAMLADIIKREISRGGQVFIVYNRVESIDHFAYKIKELVNSAKIIVAHGQLESNILEKRIYDFSQGLADILVCTTIIENGIDMPNANTLIVYDADKLGLSQLYQLRGRVGRSNRLAYAYFVYATNKLLTEVAYKRLTSIMQYTELGSGFKIAMKDLEIRGAGNILGREQHGQMVKVGYSMYTKLLDEAIQELKGNANEQFDTVLDIDVSAHLPNDYIDYTTGRMEFYQRVASITELNEAKQIIAELTDMYGTPPDEVINLLAIAQIKLLCNKLGFKLFTIKKGNATLEFADNKYLTEQLLEAITRYKQYCSLSSQATLKLIINPSKNSLETLKFVYKFLLAVSK